MPLTKQQQVDIYSDVCNITILSGLPSFWSKRDDEHLSTFTTIDWKLFWINLFAGVVLGLVISQLSTIWYRSKVAVIRPVISMVRMPATITVYHECIRYVATHFEPHVVFAPISGPLTSSDSVLGPDSMLVTCTDGPYVQRRRTCSTESFPSQAGSERYGMDGLVDFEEVEVSSDEKTLQKLRDWSRPSSARSSLDVNRSFEPTPVVRPDDWTEEEKETNLGQIADSGAILDGKKDRSHILGDKFDPRVAGGVSTAAETSNAATTTPSVQKGGSVKAARERADAAVKDSIATDDVAKVQRATFANGFNSTQSNDALPPHERPESFIGTRDPSPQAGDLALFKPLDSSLLDPQGEMWKFPDLSKEIEKPVPRSDVFKPELVPRSEPSSQLTEFHDKAIDSTERKMPITATQQVKYKQKGARTPLRTWRKKLLNF